jgi:MbtH protein
MNQSFINNNMMNQNKIINDISNDPFNEYVVVKNGQEHYSIWPTIKKVPQGWETMEIIGTKSHCLSWIEENWNGPTL